VVAYDLHKTAMERELPVEKLEKKPETTFEFAALRCKAACKMGRDAMDGEIPSPSGVREHEYALYHLLHAIEELSVMIEEIKSSK